MDWMECLRLEIVNFFFLERSRRFRSELTANRLVVGGSRSFRGRSSFCVVGEARVKMMMLIVREVVEFLKLGEEGSSVAEAEVAAKMNYLQK